MSVYGTWLPATIPMGDGISAVVDLGRDYDHLSVQIPQMDECQIHLQVAESESGTYYDLGKDTTTNRETFNRADVWRLGGYQFVKVVVEGTQQAERLIRVRGMRY